MQYKLTQKHNPANRREKAKWYAVPVNSGKITAFQLSRQIIIRNKADKEAVKMATQAITQEITDLLLNGYSVNFGKMGTFRISFSSEGVENKENFNSGMINNIKVIFTPSVELQEKIKNHL